MARGETQLDFAAAAAEDGIVLERQSLPWLCERGHLVLPNVAAEARVLLERIYIALGADLDLLDTARSNRLPGDFVHPETGTLIEIDESQHFTTPRPRRSTSIRPTFRSASKSSTIASSAGGGGSNPTTTTGRRRPAALVLVAARSSAPTTTRSATSRPQRWGIRR